MARSKPTRSIELTYAKIRQTNDAGTLFPCFIAPRYILHTIEQGNAYVAKFTNGTAPGLLKYPEVSETVATTLDINSAKIKLTDIVLQVITGLSITAHSNNANCFTVSAQDTALTKYTLRIGDLVIANGAEPCKITDIRKVNNNYEVYTNSNQIKTGTVDICTSSIAPQAYAVNMTGISAKSEGVELDNTSLQVMVGKNTYTVHSASIHIEYRECITEETFTLMSGDSEGLDDFVGVANPLNTLGFFAYCARLAETSAFYVMAIPDDSYASYEKALNIALKYENVFAPITHNQSEAVRSLLIEKKNEYNDPSIAQFKKLWFVDDTEKTVNVYTQTAEGAKLMATLTAEGVVSFKNGDLIAAGVLIGDILTMNDKTYKISEVTDTDSLKVLNPVKDEIDVETLVTVTRELSNFDYANTVGDKAADLDSAYINYVWADEPVCIGFGKTENVFLLATLTALRSTMAPHAPLSEVTVPGWTVSETMGLSEHELDIMNDKGVWIVHKDRYGEVVTRHQLTTVQDGTLAEEDSAVSNACNIIRSIRSMLYQYRGDSNVTTELLDALNADIRHGLDRIMARIYPVKIGRQITDYSVKDLRIDDDNRARIILDVDIDVPEPLLDGHFKFNII